MEEKPLIIQVVKKKIHEFCKTWRSKLRAPLQYLRHIVFTRIAIHGGITEYKREVLIGEWLILVETLSHISYQLERINDIAFINAISVEIGF